MKAMELYDKVQEIAQSKTKEYMNNSQNSVVFAILQLSSLVNRALEEGMNANVIDEILRDALNSCEIIYL